MMETTEPTMESMRAPLWHHAQPAQSSTDGTYAKAQDTVFLPSAAQRKLRRLAQWVLTVAVVASLVAIAQDGQRFAFSYLIGFEWVTTVALGALFFVMVQHLTRAGWSVTARRHMEWVCGFLPVTALLFIPVAWGASHLYHHWMDAHALHDPILRGKSGYLNVPFFYMRAVFFFISWTALAGWFCYRSGRQDRDGDPRHTLALERWSAPALFLYALTLTFAAFDWVMSLEPHWYSTIFGVYVFAGSVTSSLSLLALITLALQKWGGLQHVSTVEHRHDIGKLLFAFIVFWAYIGFSQYFLIWYANLTEETVYYLRRWEGSWKYVSLLLVLGHFVLPFWVLLSRTAKRNAWCLGIAASWMLFMHYIDLYWMIMPVHMKDGASFGWIELVGLLGPAGVMFFFIARKIARGPLYPPNDPRLLESIQLVNW